MNKEQKRKKEKALYVGRNKAHRQTDIDTNASMILLADKNTIKKVTMAQRTKLFTGFGTTARSRKFWKGHTGIEVFKFTVYLTSMLSFTLFKVSEHLY